MLRLGERLTPYGPSVTSTVQWGRTTYTGIRGWAGGNGNVPRPTAR
ncbi:hypothetical protein AB0I02_05105 [Streptomyces phaeochromogenes]